MTAKEECLYRVRKYCGKCGEFRSVTALYCPECNNRLRTRPKDKYYKEKYKLSKRY